MRINEVPVEVRGEPPEDSVHDERVTEQREEATEKNKDGRPQLEQTELEFYKREADLLQREKELLITENEVLRRMTELQIREQANETKRDKEGTKDSGQMIDNVRENDGIRMIDEGIKNDSRQMIGNTEFSNDGASAQESVAAGTDLCLSNPQQYGMLKEMLPEYGGGSGLDVWLAQVKSTILEIYIKWTSTRFALL